MQDSDNSTQQAAPYVGPERRTPRFGVDLTINIPTMITILVLIVSTSATGVGLYYNLDKRQTATDYAVANLTTRVERVEGSVNSIKTDQALSNDRLRSEMKADLAEIKGQLEHLIFNPPPNTQRQLREWSR
jgi:hypothetical protein